jgi:hypothetical protein
MCHAILRIAYHHDKAREVVEVEKAEDFERRLTEIRTRPGVRKVTIFKPHMSYEEVSKWEVTDHTTGETKDESQHQNIVVTGQSYLATAEAVTRDRQATEAHASLCEGIESPDGADSAKAEDVGPV